MNIGILGLGTVGGGVVNVLRKNEREIFARTGEQINITHGAVKSLAEPRICDDGDINITEDAFEIVNNPDVDVVLELIGGTTIAKDLVITAINNNKHVITANKALIAEHGDELFELANKNNVYLGYEAVVAGAIPVINSLTHNMSNENILSISGIINGTCNFILDQMSSENKNFSESLKNAQERGYAEADPTFDIGGFDAAHKI